MISPPTKKKKKKKKKSQKKKVRLKGRDLSGQEQKGQTFGRPDSMPSAANGTGVSLDLPKALKEGKMYPVNLDSVLISEGGGEDKGGKRERRGLLGLGA